MTREKIISRKSIIALTKKLCKSGKKIVFTNGCFDLLHLGHIHSLQRARRMGDFLIVGMNSDRSVRRIKGRGRPVQPERDRKEILAALECVDAVVVFHEPTPFQIIEAIRPDVLVKGADWPRGKIVGADLVNAAGGKVARIPITAGRSTSSLLRRIRNIPPRQARGKKQSPPGIR